MNISDLIQHLPRLAAAVEAHGEAAMGNGNDPLAADMFRIMEWADGLYLAMTTSAETEQLVGELMAKEAV